MLNVCQIPQQDLILEHAFLISLFLMVLVINEFNQIHHILVIRINEDWDHFLCVKGAANDNPDHPDYGKCGRAGISRKKGKIIQTLCKHEKARNVVVIRLVLRTSIVIYLANVG